MDTLSDLLAGNQNGPVRPTGVQDPGYEQRKSGWKTALDSMVQDPVNAMMMLQFGSSLANIQPGQGVGAQVSNAFTDAFAMRGRYEQILRDRQAAEAESQMKQERQEMDKQRIGFEGDRLGLEGERLGMTREENEANRKLEREKLGLMRDRLKMERGQGEKGGGSGTKSSELDKLTAALMETEGLTEAQARILAFEMDKKTTRQDRIRSVADFILSNEIDMNFTPEDAFEQAAELVDEYDRKRAALEGQQTQVMNIDMHPGWAGVSPEKKARMLELVSSGRPTQEELRAWLDSRKGQ